jgi:hypothetical protein
MDTPTRRPTRRPVTALVIALGLSTALSACGDEDSRATDPVPSTSSSSPSETPTETPSETPSESTPAPTGQQLSIPATGSAGVTEATVVSATEGGGSVSPTAFALDGKRAVRDFTGDLEAGLADSVRAVVADISEPGTTTYGTVAAIGCEPPRSVAVEAGEAGFEVVPQVPKSTVQCLAPVTYVVVFAAPDA